MRGERVRTSAAVTGAGGGTAAGAAGLSCAAGHAAAVTDASGECRTFRDAAPTDTWVLASELKSRQLAELP